jgi:CHAT domain-containing protein/tetratricopeptide (TPR) repeat protein
MVVCLARRWMELIVLLAALVVGTNPIGAQAQDANELPALREQVSHLHSQRKYAEALPLAERYVALARQRHGEDHAEFGTAITWMGRILGAQQRYAEAEPVFQRSIAVREKALGTEHPDVGISLNYLASVYRGQGRYAEAEPLLQRSLAMKQKALGAEHPDVGTALINLAGLYNSQSRYAEAEPLLQRSLAIKEKALGPGHPDVAAVLSNLAGLYHGRGRYAEAEPLFQRSLAIREKELPPGDAQIAFSLSSLASLYHAQGRYSEAEPLFQRSLALREKTLGPEHSDIGKSLLDLAFLYRAQARYAEAEPLFQRSLALREKALGVEHLDVGMSLSNLAALYLDQGRYAEAEPLFQRSLALREKALGSEHRNIGLSLLDLALLYRGQGRYAEAEPLFLRSLAIREKALGPEHPDVGMSLSNLAALYLDQGRYAEAEPLFQRSLALREKALGPEHRDVGLSLLDLATLNLAQGRLAEAEPMFQRSLAIREKALGPEHPDVAMSLSNLAVLYLAQGRFSETEPLQKRSLAIRERALGREHPDVGTSLQNLALLAFLQRDWLRAADFWRRSTDILVRRAQRGTDEVGRALIGKAKGEAERLNGRFMMFVKTAYRLGLQGRAEGSLPNETFKMAQWALSSEAAGSLAQMAARGAKGDRTLAALVRERQDVVEEWQRRDGARTTAVAGPPETRDRSTEAVNVARLTAIDARVGEIDKRLAADFPDYAALARPAPLSVGEVQAQLASDEALVMVLDTPDVQPTPEETFIWVVTKTEVRWVRTDFGTPALTREVAALRCGLDAAAWEDKGAAKCAGLLKITPDKAPKGNAPLPFDIARTHSLYKALFGQVEDLIGGKHLLIVPSGPLTQLPFQVLVTASPANGDYRSAAWLAREHPITVLPAVSSLKALRRIGKPSAATKPLIGFGNPLLDGDPAERPWEVEWAKLARQKQTCPQTPWQHVAALFERRRSVVPMAMPSGRPDLAHLRVQVPLHDTADELCAVAKDLKLTADDILLGARATEAMVKQLSGEGKLADYRVVHFATHGALSGEISGTSEPGLIMTPPAEQTETDDGYLSASEVAALKLDADWVILSACNTAAGGARGAEALSGLARAFFYAGARAMLVSHWAVDSAATVKLITHAVGATTRDKTLGRAEALRRAMLAMIDQGENREAHPAFWAPFVVVGEGAAK